MTLPNCNAAPDPVGFRHLYGGDFQAHGEALEWPDVPGDERAIRGSHRRARACRDAGGTVRAPLHATLPDEAAVAEAVAADTTYWGLVHLTAAVASGLLVLAFLAIRSYLQEAGEER